MAVEASKTAGEAAAGEAPAPPVAPPAPDTPPAPQLGEGSGGQDGGDPGVAKVTAASYRCAECGKDCFTSNSLRSHFRRFHARPEDLPCLLCDTLVEQRGLNDHERQRHPAGDEVYWCHVCLSRYPLAADLFWHIRGNCGVN